MIEYDLWRNLLDEPFMIALDGFEYWVCANGFVTLPSHFRDIPRQRGLAIQFVQCTTNGEWEEITTEAEYLAMEAKAKTTDEQRVEIAQAFLAKPKSKKKKTK